MTERLGSGLQNRRQQFESARYLNEDVFSRPHFFVLSISRRKTRAEERKQNMIQKVTIIGTGRVATYMAYVLVQKGVDIVEIGAHHSENAVFMAQLTGAPVAADLKHLKKAEVYIIAVKDSAIENVSRTIREQYPEAFLIHTSGATPIEVLEDGKKNAPCGVIYPLQTFPKSLIVGSVKNLKNFLHAHGKFTIFVESLRNTDYDAVYSLAQLIADDVHAADSVQRRYLHLVGVYCNNFVNHCCVKAQEILTSKNLPINVLDAIVHTTVAGIVGGDAKSAQSGPAMRGDRCTLQRHMDMLATDIDKQMYAAISKSIASMYKVEQ